MADSDAVKALDEAKELVDFWLDGGTLLGICRDGKLIDGETKLDLLMWHPGYESIQRLKKEFKKRDFSVYYDREERGHCFAVTKYGYELAFGLLKPEGEYSFLKFYVPHKRIGGIVDGALKKVGMRTKLFTFFMVLKLPNHFYSKFKEIEFEGIKLKMPFETEKYLEFRYGEGWKKRKPDYVWFKEDGAIMK